MGVEVQYLEGHKSHPPCFNRFSQKSHRISGKHWPGSTNFLLCLIVQRINIDAACILFILAGHHVRYTSFYSSLSSLWNTKEDFSTSKPIHCNCPWVNKKLLHACLDYHNTQAKATLLKISTPGESFQSQNCTN